MHPKHWRRMILVFALAALLGAPLAIAALAIPKTTLVASS